MIARGLDSERDELTCDMGGDLSLKKAWFEEMNTDDSMNSTEPRRSASVMALTTMEDVTGEVTIEVDGMVTGTDESSTEVDGVVTET